MPDEYTKKFNDKEEEIHYMWNYFSDGDKGDYVWDDYSGRAIVRLEEAHITNLPNCALYENKEYVGEASLPEAINFLYGAEIFRVSAPQVKEYWG